MKIIDNFAGPYSFLSNFHPCRITMDGELYVTLEHAYQAAKTADKIERVKIRAAIRAGTAKREGARLTLRHDWDVVKERVMLDLLRQKFSAEPFKELLKRTGDAELIEGNHWHDNFWGRCRCPWCEDREKHNRLGVLLMQIRGEMT